MGDYQYGLCQNKLNYWWLPDFAGLDLADCSVIHREHAVATDVIRLLRRLHPSCSLTPPAIRILLMLFPVEIASCFMGHKQNQVWMIESTIVRRKTHCLSVAILCAVPSRVTLGFSPNKLIRALGDLKTTPDVECQGRFLSLFSGVCAEPQSATWEWLPCFGVLSPHQLLFISLRGRMLSTFCSYDIYIKFFWSQTNVRSDFCSMFCTLSSLHLFPMHRISQNKRRMHPSRTHPTYGILTN